MATLEDIARKVGVSKSTVSKALSGAGDVSEAMRRTVLDAAVELGYSRLRRIEEFSAVGLRQVGDSCCQIWQRTILQKTFDILGAERVLVGGALPCQPHADQRDLRGVFLFDVASDGFGAE